MKTCIVELQKAVFEALSTLTDAPCYGIVPPNTEPPYRSIGSDVSNTWFSNKSNNSELVTITINHFTRGKSFIPCKQLAAATVEKLTVPENYIMDNFDCITAFVSSIIPTSEPDFIQRVIVQIDLRVKEK